ncbi:hypothetical protein [Desulfobotulus sp.]|uniref:hypothetical protein n=1 Tax=Desulfobotulus sp. TaxID=1940337 RepID=UPI002A3632A7|nr:hypothetical protein [Desulfobotulus sp.]MDY0164314.1 hypothetical protein [Desulfobotulus sp.]
MNANRLLAAQSLTEICRTRWKMALLNLRKAATNQEILEAQAHVDRTRRALDNAERTLERARYQELERPRIEALPRPRI